MRSQDMFSAEGAGMKARLAVVGLGLIGRRHIAAIAQSAGAVLAAVVDPAKAAAEQAAALGVPHFDALGDCLAAGGIDGVILATPNQLHIEGGDACVDAGVPVLIEKPIATDAAAARALVQRAEAKGVAIATGHHRRHNPLIAAARQAIQAGEIGKVVSVNCMFWLTKPDDYFDVEWRRAPGAGPVFVNLIHDLDLMRHLVGDIRAVQAFRSSAIRGNPVEETCVIAFEFENGALGTANASDTIAAPWSWELTAGENPAYPRSGESCYQIGGTHGAIEIPSGRIWSYAGHRSWWEPIQSRVAPCPQGDPLVRQIDQFARVVAGVEPPLVSGRDGLRTLEAVTAVLHAAETWQRVVLG